MPCATILIAARNAAQTIQRAVRSALLQGDYPILLIDDFSIDDTVAQAITAANENVRVVHPIAHSTMGITRQTGLEHVSTPFAVWLDADDEFLPGRVNRLVAALKEDDADLAADAAELSDGLTGQPKGILPMPHFLTAYRRQARLFERNHLPGIGCIAFRTSFARSIGYDASMHGAEDVDFALRAVAAKANFALLTQPGYRIHTYPFSLSRQLDNQRGMYRHALLKHSYEAVLKLLGDAGHTHRVALWALVSMAIFRQEYDQALDFLEEVSARTGNPMEILEPEGPCPLPEAWRISFQRGTLLLLIAREAAAAKLLQRAEEFRPSAEGANNLGVALARMGNLQGARECFCRSLYHRPEYLDARINLESERPERITSHPLRLQPNRSDYAAPTEPHTALSLSKPAKSTA